MISALIITKDNYERVKNLCTLLNPYVDEIVVFHSSQYLSHQFKGLKEISPKIYTTYRAERGYVEAYYDEGIELCKHDWILLLDDDEIPSLNLLKSLDIFCAPIRQPVMIYIPRHEPTGKVGYVTRLFHKDSVVITGLIHRGIEPKDNVQYLDKAFYITHKPTQSTSKCKRYAKIEAEQYPQIIGHVAKKNKYLQYAYFFVSSIPRVMFAPNRKDLLIYLTYLWKELRTK